jgi:hypothetical protein
VTCWWIGIWYRAGSFIQTFKMLVAFSKRAIYKIPNYEQHHRYDLLYLIKYIIMLSLMLSDLLFTTGVCSVPYSVPCFRVFPWFWPSVFPYSVFRVFKAIPFFRVPSSVFWHGTRNLHPY